MPVGGNISDLICPAPPSHGQWISRETLGGLIIPKPSCENEVLAVLLNINVQSHTLPV